MFPSRYFSTQPYFGDVRRWKPGDSIKEGERRFYADLKDEQGTQCYIANGPDKHQLDILDKLPDQDNHATILAKAELGRKLAKKAPPEPVAPVTAHNKVTPHGVHAGHPLKHTPPGPKRAGSHLPD